MDRQRTNRGISLVLWLAAAVFVVYSAGYFAVSDFMPRDEGGHLALFEPPGSVPSHYRIFRSEWLATIYRPAGWVESKLRGAPVDISSDKDWVSMQ